MSKWKEFRLSEVMDIIGGGTPKTSISEYWGGDIPWLSVVDFGNGNKFVEKTEKYITELGLKNSSTKILKSGQIIISARGTVGELAMLKGDMAFNQSCYGLNAKEDICSNNFLYYLLKIKISELKSNAHGAVFDTITRATFETISVIIPSLEKQSYIAEILSSLDDKIELNNKISQELEALGKTLYKQWFIDFEFPNENGEPYKSSGGEMVDSELGELPNGWKVEDLSNLFDFLEGPGLRNWQYRLEGMPFINIRLIQDGDIKKNNISYISDEEFDSKYKHFALQEGDLVVSTSGTLGKSAIVRKNHLPMMLNTSVIRFRPFEPTHLSYMYQYLQSKSFIDEVKASATGSVQLNFGPVHLKNIKLIKPQNQLLEQFEYYLSPIYKKIQHLKSESDEISKTRDTLLPKLISGELEINEISN
jgi:type I restriction enzyme S subunit